jgi:hypothetical protein
MYSSLGEILRGWSRIFFGTFGTLRRLTISLTVLLVMGLLPYVAAGLGLALAWNGAAPAGLWWACGFVGLAACLLQVSVMVRFYGMVGSSRLFAPTYPLGCCVAMVALCQAIGKLRKGATVVWRNTQYAQPGRQGQG